MSGHTPGPWILKHVQGSNFAVQRFEIRGLFGSKHGAASIFNRDTSAIDGTTICCSPQDASLIAAAPELLEALELAGQSAGFQYMTIETREAISAAIAKAKGGV